MRPTGSGGGEAAQGPGADALPLSLLRSMRQYAWRVRGASGRGSTIDGKGISHLTRGYNEFSKEQRLVPYT